MNSKRFNPIVLVLILLGLAWGGWALYNWPPINERLAWRVANVQAQVREFFNPPEQQVFVPQELPTLAVAIATFTPEPTATPLPTEGPTATPTAPPTQTPVPTPLPGKITLTGFKHEYQKFNNCGPATLSMNLTFWGWQGDQLVTRQFLRPGFEEIDDKNTGPAEMVAYVNAQTQLRALTRVNGTLPLLKQFLAVGLPVIIERGLQLQGERWEGHYVLLTGYDDARQKFVAQDALIMPDLPIPYAELEEAWWRDFNYQYVVVYPPEREAEVFALLGPDANEFANYQRAAERAAKEIAELTGRNQFFAYYNLGSSLVGLQDYAGAAQAFDKAFALYPTLPEDERPYRAWWYLHAPYEAYYHTERYRDVINLADTALATASEPGLEEVLYWKGMAQVGISQRTWAIESFKAALLAHPNFAPAEKALEELGE
jgi:hypothetical protein